MDKSLWESLLDDINALKKKDAPSADDAPKIQSLLRQVNELSGTTPPAAPAATKPAGDVLTGGSGSATLAGGSGNDDLKSSMVGNGEEKLVPSPSSAQVKKPAEAHHDASRSGDPGPEGAGRAGPIDPKTLTGEQIFDALQVPKDPAVFAKGDWKKKMESTLEALAELDRTNPGRAKEIRAKVSALHEARAKAAAKPTGADEVRDRVTPTATAKILPDGNRTVVVNATTPKKGAALPADSVRVPDKEMTPDEMLATLRGMARHVGQYTDQERKAGTSLAYRLERLKERDPKAFGKLPGELQNFLGFFKEQMDDERSALVPKNLKDTTVELPPDVWEKITDKSTDHALMRSVRAFGPRTAMRGAANKLADWVEDANKYAKIDKVTDLVEDYRDATRRAIPVPPEYEKDPVLQVAEEVGGVVGKSAVKRAKKYAAKKGREVIESLLKIFKK